MIEREFGVRYHPAHVSRLLRAVGWSVQQPLRRATQRDEAAIAAWSTERWPARKKADAEGRLVLWVDESGFYLLPAAVRTYAPRGQTPILRVPLSLDHLSVISAISPDADLFLLAQEWVLNGADVARFLLHLLDIVLDPLLVIWDGGPSHRSLPVKNLLAKVGRDRLQVEPLPAYAPDLNPDEGIWNYLKLIELRNACCQNLRHLREALREAAIRVCTKPEIIQGCVREAGYHV